MRETTLARRCLGTRGSLIEHSICGAIRALSYLRSIVSCIAGVALNLRTGALDDFLSVMPSHCLYVLSLASVFICSLPSLLRPFSKLVYD